MSYRFCFKVSTSTSFTTINNESEYFIDWLKYIFWGGIQYSPGSKFINEYLFEKVDDSLIVSVSNDSKISKGIKFGISSNEILYLFFVDISILKFNSSPIFTSVVSTLVDIIISWSKFGFWLYNNALEHRYRIKKFFIYRCLKYPRSFFT